MDRMPARISSRPHELEARAPQHRVCAEDVVHQRVVAIVGNARVALHQLAQGESVRHLVRAHGPGSYPYMKRWISRVSRGP